MKRQLIALASLLAIACGAGSVSAQQNRQDSPDRSPPAPPSDQDRQNAASSNWAKQFINDFDDDNDGSLSRNELPRRLRNQFGRLDQNKDDQLTREELRQHTQSSQRRRPVQPIEFVYIWVSDADQGSLSLNELQRAYDTLQKIDKDGDGELARQELQACRQANLDRWARMVTTRLDENNDNQISEDEAQGSFLTGRFDEIDSDGDGKIQRSELQDCASQQHDQTASGGRDVRTSRQDHEFRDDQRQSDRSSDREDQD
jgi:Ca2+-binding EF-hand superfamily protein